jgi:GT2 family glycosyltransferase
MKVAIGVPTFNRSDLVELHAKSLCASNLPPETILIVIDDASTEYDVNYLRSIFPKVADIRRRSTNSGGADFAIRHLMEHLVETDAEAVMLLDSDMLVVEDFLQHGEELLQQSDGVISLFPGSLFFEKNDRFRRNALASRVGARDAC